MFSYDNVTKQTPLRDQRGNSARHLDGTHMVAHEVNPYNNTSFDDIKVTNSYDENQISVYPDGMRMYETVDLESPSLGTTAFLRLDGIAKSDVPDASGARVRAYNDLANISTFVVAIGNNFTVPDSNFDMCPININVAHLLELNSLVHSAASKQTIQNCRMFR